MSDTDLLLRPVTDLSRMISAGELSPVDLVNATLQRIEFVQPELNAYLEIFESELIAGAESAEGEIRKYGAKSPLHGIPVGLKDLVDVKGKITTGGSAATERVEAKTDSTVAKRLRAAGALLTGKLNLVEFAFGFSSVNPHTGDVKNPWNTERVAAGSSSGSAASVASGAAAMAIGTDTGGSVRMPAAACGITGLKPTYGLVSRHGVMDLSWSSDHVGPMCRTAADCALMMNAMAGFDSNDPASSRHSISDYGAELGRGLKGVRIGVPSDYFFDQVDPQISTAVESAIQAMQGEGAVIREVAMPWVSVGRAVNVAVLLPEAAAVHRKRLAEKGNQYSPAVRHRLKAGLEVSAVDYIHAQRARSMFGHQMTQAMEDLDALVTPTVPIQTPTIAETTPPPGSAIPQAGGEFPNFTGVFNATGQPSMSLNCGFTEDGMPIGLMISGKAFEDARLIGIGHAYQQITDWHCRKPSVIG